MPPTSHSTAGPAALLRALVPCLAAAAVTLLLLRPAPAGEEKVPGLARGHTGIARKHPGDKGIAKHRSVVFAEDFESGLPVKSARRWSEVKNVADMSLSDEVPANTGGKRSLLYTHVGGKNTGGHLYKNLKPGHDRLFLRFYTRFAEDCFPIHHFVHMGGYEPQTDWPQGGAGERPDGRKRFSTAVEPHGRSWVWDYYTYWKDMGGSPPRGQTWGNSFLRKQARKVERGKWTCLELMAQMNDVGASNGEQALWIDGKLVSHLGEGFPKGKWTFDKFQPGEGGTQLRWDDATGGRIEKRVPRGGAPFEGFEWRTSEDLDLSYLWMLLFITKAPEGKVSRVWFDDIVLATEYVGPLFGKTK